MSKFDNSDYIDVAQRIADFRAAHPEGSLQPVDPLNPYRVEIIGPQTFIVYTAAAYRAPDDERPGIGVAWEPCPGKTPFTKDSELMNAETSAWGRAIVAALAGDTKRSVASAEEVRNRQVDRAVPTDGGPISKANADALVSRCEEHGLDVTEVVRVGTDGRTTDPAEVLKSEIRAVKAALDELAGAAL